MVEYSHGTIRAVTHYGETRADVEHVVRACAKALSEIPAHATSRVAATAMER
jgi:hypothetical protein